MSWTHTIGVNELLRITGKKKNNKNGISPLYFQPNVGEETLFQIKTWSAI